MGRENLSWASTSLLGDTGSGGLINVGAQTGVQELNQGGGEFRLPPMFLNPLSGPLEGVGGTSF